MEHICTVCFRPVEDHDSKCDCGIVHFPPLCCAGCECGSFEDAHKGETESEVRKGIILFSKRRKITELAEEWCSKNDVPTHPFNIVTALVSLGLIKE